LGLSLLKERRQQVHSSTQGCCLQQLIVEPPAVSTPQLIKSNDLIAELMKRDTQKREGSARCERYTEEWQFLRTAASGSAPEHHPSAREDSHRAGVRLTVHWAQIEDQVCASIGQ
jgi:hypothetical protein